MPDSVDELLIDVRASTQGFSEDIARMRRDLDSDLVVGFSRAGDVLETVHRTFVSATSDIRRMNQVNAEVAKLAVEAGVKQVVLDRGSYKYHGRVKAFADAAREGGLDF